MMFDDLVEKNQIQIFQEDIDFVKDLIKGVPFHSKGRYEMLFAFYKAHLPMTYTYIRVPPEKPFLFEIVANKRNGIDVDKLVATFSPNLAHTVCV
jgi:Na+-transporting NADH:ubiquinone oxidoreductase subunit NqrB